MDVLSLTYGTTHVGRIVGGYSEITAGLSTARVRPLVADRIPAGILTPQEEGRRFQSKGKNSMKRLGMINDALSGN